MPAGVERSAAGNLSAGSGNSYGPGPCSSLPCESSGKWPTFLLCSRPSSAGAGAGRSGELFCPGSTAHDGLIASGKGTGSCSPGKQSSPQPAVALRCHAHLILPTCLFLAWKQASFAPRCAVGGLCADIVAVSYCGVVRRISKRLGCSRFEVFTTRRASTRHAADGWAAEGALPHAADGSRQTGHEPVGRHHT